MKAITIITSHEYYMNTPSVFAIVDGRYFGCLIYPSFNGYPAPEYWLDATSSDSDRGFTVVESVISEEQLNDLKKLQNCTVANAKMVVRKSWPTIKKEWAIRRGKVYQAYKSAMDAQYAEMKAENDYNHPFEAASRIAGTAVNKLLISLK